MKLPLLTSILLPFLVLTSGAQEITKFSRLELTYGVALQGYVQQTVERDSKGNLTLQTSITPGGRTATSRFTRKAITEDDIAPLVTLLNDGDTRTYFRNKTIIPVLDGSGLALAATQGSFSISFSSQNPFDKNTDEQQKKLEKASSLLFKMAGLTTPPTINADKNAVRDPDAIIIPNFDISNCSVPDAMLLLEKLSVASDPLKKGIAFTFDPSVDRTKLKPISIKLQNIPAYEVAMFIASLSELKLETVQSSYILVKRKDG